MSGQTPEFQTPTTSTRKRKFPSPTEIAALVRAGKLEVSDSLLDKLSPQQQEEVLAAWLLRLKEDSGGAGQALETLQQLYDREREFDNVHALRLQFSSVERRHHRFPSPSQPFESGSMADSRTLMTKELFEDSPQRVASSPAATASPDKQSEASFTSDVNSSVSSEAEQIFLSDQLQPLSTPIKASGLQIRGVPGQIEEENRQLRARLAELERQLQSQRGAQLEEANRQLKARISELEMQLHRQENMYQEYKKLSGELEEEIRIMRARDAAQRGEAPKLH